MSQVKYIFCLFDQKNVTTGKKSHKDEKRQQWFMMSINLSTLFEDKNVTQRGTWTENLVRSNDMHKSTIINYAQLTAVIRQKILSTANLCARFAAKTSPRFPATALLY